jgi:tRNA G10  N-methylase Trm11
MRARMPGGEPEIKRMLFPASNGERLSHYLFRYPAKFHPPVVRHLIQQYTAPQQIILDPFCGSGTLLVEAMVSGRNAIGSDVDPLAVFITRVKTRAYDLPLLERESSKVLARIGKFARSDKEYERRKFEDIAESTVDRLIGTEKLVVPTDLPNLYHWFRKYVLIDLGRILTYLDRAKLADAHRDFFKLCFASIIRAASNADPVPVSGVEVTSHMKRLEEKGRLINPIKLYTRAVQRGLIDVTAFQQVAKTDVQARAIQADVTNLRVAVKDKVDSVITSPPYNIAVDYYRRHLLEMYWLDMTRNPSERLDLLPKYIGRDKVAQKHPYVARGKIETPIVEKWERAIRSAHAGRADAFKHYVVAMQKAFHQIADALKSEGHAIFVVGHSTWNGHELPTTKLFHELMPPVMVLAEHYWYKVSNRYMSYARHNGASIDKEYVLVFKKK